MNSHYQDFKSNMLIIILILLVITNNISNSFAVNKVLRKFNCVSKNNERGKTGNSSTAKAADFSGTGV